MDHHELLSEIKQDFKERFDRVESKLDDQLQRVAVVETKVKHHQGFIKTTVAVIIAAVGSVFAYISKQLLGN